MFIIGRLQIVSTSIVCVLLGACVGIWIWLGQAHNNFSQRVTIQVTDQGFVPPKVVITSGGVVHFENKSHKPVWPASDLHPTHELYPEFDSKRGIEPGQDWDFTFFRSGQWSFHDHLSPFHVGVVSVLASGKKEVVSSDDCDMTASNTGSCAQRHILYVLKQDGLSAAFAALAKAYDTTPGFSAQCHGLTHALGAAAYDLFERHVPTGLTPQTTYCGYGFFHGFIERLVFTSGDISKAREFCAQATQELASVTQKTDTACYHGIGHGVADSAERSEQLSPTDFLSAALALCDQVGDDDRHKYLCSSGAFNSLAIAWGQGFIRSNGMDADPYALCSGQAIDYNRKACYEEMNSRVIGLYGEDLNAVLSYAMKVPSSSDRLVAVENLPPAYLVSFPSIGPTLQLAKSCRLTDPVMSRGCMEGLVGGFIERGAPGSEYSEAVQLCQLAGLHAIERDSCFSSLFSSVHYLYPAAVAEAVCQSLEATFKSYCK